MFGAKVGENVIKSRGRLYGSVCAKTDREILKGTRSVRTFSYCIIYIYIYVSGLLGLTGIHNATAQSVRNVIVRLFIYFLRRDKIRLAPVGRSV